MGKDNAKVKTVITSEEVLSAGTPAPIDPLKLSLAELLELVEAKRKESAGEAEVKLARISEIRKQVTTLNTEAGEIRLWCKVVGVKVPHADKEVTEMDRIADKVEERQSA